jgi:hypothetical protein
MQCLTPFSSEHLSSDLLSKNLNMLNIQYYIFICGSAISDIKGGTENRVLRDEVTGC